MKNLIYKEMRLVVIPLASMFSLLVFLLLIPDYPPVVGFLYFFMPVQIVFSLMATNKDIEFTMLLPVTRRQVVKAKFFVILLYEAITIILGVIASMIASLLLHKEGNLIFVSANLTLFGIVLMTYMVYNIIFLVGFFKTGYKWGFPHLFGIVGFGLSWLLLELPIDIIPALKKTLGGLSSSTFIYRMIFLFAAIMVFALGHFLAYNKASKDFGKVGL